MDGDRICMELDAFEAAGNSFARLLEEAIRLTHHSSPKFQCTGIYELCPDNVLRLGPFIGAPTKHISIPVGQGVCGSAVADKCNKNIPDVSSESNYLACSLSTKSELVVLIRKGEKIFAQIDIDSRDLNAFDKDTVEGVQKIADRLANAYAARAGQVNG